MDEHQHHYSVGVPPQNMSPRPDLSSGPPQIMPFRPYGPPAPPQNLPPRPDFHAAPPQNMPFGVFCPPAPPQNVPPRPEMCTAPQHDMRSRADFHPGSGHGSWPWFPPTPHGSSNTYSSHPSFNPTRPPPGYFPSPPPGPANLQPDLHGGFEGTWAQSQIHQVMNNQSTMDDDYHGDRSVNLGPASYQSRFQSNCNVMGHHFSTFPHGPVPSDTSATKIKSNIPDANANQRKQDERWINSFLHKRKTVASSQTLNSPEPRQSVSAYKEEMYRTVQMLSELSALCQTLKTNLENEGKWTDSYTRAMELRRSLEDRLKALTDPVKVDVMKKKLERVKKKRTWMRRKKNKLEEEKRDQQARAAEKVAAIDRQQMKQIQELEEKNRERELKQAADSVLSEVRRKQADTKRMLDVLKALEKLRKLRKEAASRKGLFPEKKSDEVFEGHLVRLRILIRKRTAVYGAEEKALRVMLEGEQEEERKRDREKRQKKEREKHLQKKREIDSMLFGADLPPDHPLQVYQQFYTQAEWSVPALVQIRRDWDQFLVPVDHPDGSSVPQSWVLPDPPADDVWATALEK
ncbi:programmed cell death protein 7 [Trichomycterus rosablanca]|uniref:programmed cell death protein 7 n=1 Tax=Trichomycterus rosablanca TaxID=2290929 RepID=UPI002F355BFC